MQCTINGITYPMTRNFNINDRLANKAATRIEVLVEDQPIPQAGDIVDIYDGDTPVFFGVAGIPVSPEYNTGNEKRIYSITCQNGNAILANRITNEAYQEMVVGQIVRDLFEKYISAEGIRMGEVESDDVRVDVYTCVNQNLQDVLNELAGLSESAWTITPDRRFIFLSKDRFPRPIDTLTEQTLRSLGKLRETTKAYRLRTAEHLAGATDMTSSQTETFLYLPDMDTFTVGFPIARKPTIKINGTDVTSHVGVSGLDDSNKNKYFFFSYDSNVVYYRYSGSGTAPLTEGDTVTITYRGIFPIRVVARNEKKISQLANRYGTSGLIERVDQSSARTLADANREASAYLLEYSEITHGVTFRILTEDLARLGVTLDTFNVMAQLEIWLPAYNITGNFVVTERSLAPAAADMTSSGARYRMLATYILQDRDYLAGYGVTLSSMQSDIARLSVREDELAIQGLEFAESRNRTESTGFSDDIPLFPTFSPIQQWQYYMNFPGVYNNTEGLGMYAGA